LISLRELYLSNNHRRYLWQIQELQYDIFNNLQELYSLNLNYNKIIDLQPDIFINLIKLKYLNLLPNNYYGLSLQVIIFLFNYF
jgi:hypothetical protein